MTRITDTTDDAVLSDARAREVLQTVRGSALWLTDADAISAMLAFAKEATPPATDAAASGAGEDTVAFVQEWLMSTDYDPTKFDRDFAAAIDARVAAAAPKVASDTGAGFSEQAWAEAVRETDRLCYELDITNADHIVLWLEHQLNGHAGPLAYIACRILDAHEAALATDATDGATVASEAAGLREAAQALVDRFPTEWPDYSPCYDEVTALRAALTHPAPSGASGEWEEGPLQQVVAGIIEMSLERHGVDLDECEGTLEDADEAIAAVLRGTTTPGGELLEQAARVADKVAQDEEEAGEGGGREWSCAQNIAARIRALSPARDGAGS